MVDTFTLTKKKKYSIFNDHCTDFCSIEKIRNVLANKKNEILLCQGLCLV